MWNSIMLQIHVLDCCNVTDVSNHDHDAAMPDN